jgi:hypothetical protein
MTTPQHNGHQIMSLSLNVHVYCRNELLVMRQGGNPDAKATRIDYTSFVG